MPVPRQDRIRDAVRLVTREADVFAEIVAQPASDAARLIWADLVGGERAELVMLQCAASSDRVWSNRRERELLGRHGLAWSGLAGLVRHARFVRGFVEAIDVDTETFIARGDEILARAPLVTSLTVHTSDGSRIDDVIEHPAFANIRAFDLADRVDADDSRSDHAASVLARTGKLAQLTAFGGRGITTAGIAALRATNLQRVWLRDTTLRRDDLHQLAVATPLLVELDLDASSADFSALAGTCPHLTSLVLRGAHSGTITELAASTLAPQITRLVVEARRDRALDPMALRTLDRVPLRSLELRNTSRETLRTLAAMALVDLRELVLAPWTDAIDDLRALVTRFAPQLEVLDLRRTNRLGPIAGDLDVLVDEACEPALLGTPAKWYVVPPVDPSGPPTMPASLVCEVGPEPGRIWNLGSLGAVQIRLGRSVVSEVVIASPSMARVHARIIWHDDAFWIRDMRSTNGTQLDGRSVENDQPLRDGSEIILGAVSLQFFQGDGAGARATACALRLATHEPLSRLPRATPAGAAELRIANLSQLEQQHGVLAGDAAIRALGRRLRDPAVSSPSRGELRVFPPDRAAALAAICDQPIDHEGLTLEIRIETKLPS
jgi:hypothetical protein